MRPAVTASSVLFLAFALPVITSADGSASGNGNTLTITVVAKDSVELIDSAGHRDGYRAGTVVREIPGCTRDTYEGEPSAGDSSETPESTDTENGPITTVFELEPRHEGEYRLVVHGPLGGLVQIATMGGRLGGEPCGSAASDSVAVGQREWRVGWKVTANGCASEIRRIEMRPRGVVTTGARKRKRAK